jgi:hypothetical protein
VPRSRKCGSIHRLLHTPSWRKQQPLRIQGKSHHFYTRFRTINLPYFPPYPFPVRTCYRMMRRGRSLISPPMHKYPIVSRLLYITMYASHIRTKILSLLTGDPDSSVDVVTGYGLVGRGIRVIFPGVEGYDLCSSGSEDRRWGLPTVLSTGYRGLKLTLTSICCLR